MSNPVNPLRSGRGTSRAGPQTGGGTSPTRRPAGLPLWRRPERDLFGNALLLFAGGSSFCLWLAGCSLQSVAAHDGGLCSFRRGGAGAGGLAAIAVLLVVVFLLKP